MRAKGMIKLGKKKKEKRDLDRKSEVQRVLKGRKKK